MTTADGPGYCEVREYTERLAEPLSPEDQTVQSMPDVSPTKWHRAHTTWFFETFVLGRYAPAYEPFHDAYAYLFNSYYESVGARHPRPSRGLLSRPGAAEIGDYRRYVDKEMGDFLYCGVPPKVVALVELGLHHEQQHQELLLMDIKHVLSCNPLLPVYDEAWAAAGESVVARAGEPAAWQAHPGGIVEIGHAGDGFCFDNETPRHRTLLEPFEIASGLVTCDEWLAFMDDGGYRRPELWMSDGWATVLAERWEAPQYWARRDGTWRVFTLGGEREVRAGDPVCHVSWFEADAFARWAGCRLPTEAEWEALAPEPEGGGSGWYGEVWQWTASPYTPYPGFRPAPGAVGEYNGKFMVNQQTLRGSCRATSPGHARRTYRNFFPPSARWAFSGLRLARE